VTYTVTRNMDSMVVIQRSNVVLDGSWHTVQGSGSGEGVSLFGVSNVTVKNLNIRGFGCGMYLFWASQNVVARNNITGNSWLGLRLYYSSNNSMYDNNILANKDDGIRFEFSSNYNSIVGNNVIANNWLGIYLDSSSSNSFYHNNLANNANQVSVDPHNLPPSNVWDNDKEGNYWSNYIGADSNYDGVGDTPYTIDSNNTDHYPLVGVFSSFRPSSAYPMEIFSNSTITNFNCSAAEKRISFNVDGQSNTVGFCKMIIPHDLVNPDHLQVLIDNGTTPSLHFNRNLYDNLTHRWVYFAYGHSIHTIVIQEDTIPPMILVLSPENKTYATRNVALTFMINESVSWMSYSLDGGANVTLTQNSTLTALADGAHSLIVYASDAVGNTGGSAVIVFVVDSTPPNIISTVQYPPVNNVLPGNNVDINATIIDNATAVKSVILTYAFAAIDGANNGSIVMTEVSPNVWTATIPKFPYRTNVTYTIAASDNAGNTITTEQLGYKYQYTVVPEYPIMFIPFLWMAGLLVIVLIARKRSVSRRCSARTVGTLS
jgi:parallel beta-helix repeat protein